MLKSLGLALVLCAVVVCQSAFGQKLPREMLRYLNDNFRGWKLAGECYTEEKENKRVLVGDF